MNAPLTSPAVSPVAAILLAAGAAFALIGPTPAASAQQYNIQVIAETGDEYVVNGTTYWVGLLGAPSLSAFGGHWNLAVNSGYVLTYTSPQIPQSHYPVPAGEAAAPSAQFNTAAYHVNNVGVYSGNTLLPRNPLNWEFGRPSAQGAFIAHVEWGGSPEIVVHGPGGRIVVADYNDGFTDMGLNPGAGNAISLGRGGLFNVVFRGHGTTPASNGIFARRYDRTQPIMTVADDTMTNPLTGFNFTFSQANPERLPVGHGSGAAWSTPEGILAKPNINGPIIPVYFNNGTYGNVSSAGPGMLAFEYNATSNPRHKVIKQNLMGWNDPDPAVATGMITRRTVLEVSMGCEALRANYTPLSNPSGGGYTLAFHAYQLNPHTENAVYVRTINRTGIDLGGMFGGNRLPGPAALAHFSFVGDDSIGEPPPVRTDFIRVRANDNVGGVLSLRQQFGSGLGVDGGPGDSYFASINTLMDGRRESISSSADYDMIVDGVTFMGLDTGESVRFLLNGVLVMDATFEGNQVDMMQGLQCIQLNSLLVPAGSTFTIEHGGGVDNGFRVSSLILGVVPPPPVCDPDFNCDGNADQDDVACLIFVIAGGPGCECQDPDFNLDGNADEDDISALINVVAGAGCP